MMKLHRRNFLKAAGAAATLAPLSRGTGMLSESSAAPPLTTMGIVEYSFYRHPESKSAYRFLDLCHSFGAAGVQVGLDSLDAAYAGKVRRHAEELGMYLEVIAELPKPDGTGNFEPTVIAAKRAGARCLRCACLGGRRYEVFKSLDQWNEFVTASHQRLARALPVLERHKMPMGIENHKDWTADELVTMLRSYSSEYLGACIDTGNNTALLDSPMHVVEALAPYAITTHFKDVALQEYAEGFEIAEVPLGQGILDLPRAVLMVHRARPEAKFNLEMITRDPLRVPCLTDVYWVTFPHRNGKYLADALARVRSHRPAHPLPGVSQLSPAAQSALEETNVRECAAYARLHLGMRRET